MELFGTSMSAAVVSGAALLMLDAEPTLNPATIKARMMKSARRIEGDMMAVGAGVLDISAAIAQTGVTEQAPSPKLVRNESSPNLFYIEDTSRTWGVDWAAGYP